MMQGNEIKRIVRDGYDALSYRYVDVQATGDGEQAWLGAALLSQLESNVRFLDVGCGCGVPMSRDAVSAGHFVTGIDISQVQVNRARQLVPDANFSRVDATQIDFAPGSFEAIACLYMMIHVPLDEQERLLLDMYKWLTPSGRLLLVTGHEAYEGHQDDWLGGQTTMWWSHHDAATYREWLNRIGFRIDEERFVPEDAGGHQAFWCHKPAV